MTTLIKSATIIDSSSPYHNQIKDILINNGVIEKIENSIASKKNYQVVSLENLHVSCGWFDSSVSLGEPGFEERETIKNGLNVAAKSGFTSVAVNANTNPVIDSNADISFLKLKANKHATNLYPIGALTRNSEGKDLAEIYDMQKSGAVAFTDGKKAILNAVSWYDADAEKVIKKTVKLSGDKLKKLLAHLDCTEAQLADFGYFASQKKGEYIIYETESDLRDTENVPLKENIHSYFLREVQPHVPEAWINLDATKIGYEISCLHL